MITSILDLTRLTDKLVTSIINSKCDDLITDVGKFIPKNNFVLGHKAFRNLVVKMLDQDARLCKRLYHYGTWLGMYPIVKVKHLKILFLFSFS